MRIPKELITVTKTSKYVALLLFISLPILAFMYGKNYQNADSQMQLRQVKNDYTTKINTLTSDLELALQDVGQVTKETTEEYNYDTFGIYSPLFEKKKVYVTVYRYRTVNIISKTIFMDGAANPATQVTVWQYPNSLSQNNRVVFGYIGNYTKKTFYPEYIHSRVEEYEGVYKTANLAYSWLYSFEPYSAKIISLNTGRDYSPTGTTLYIQLSKSIGLNTFDSDIVKAKAELQKIADTIPYRKM